MTVVKRKSAKSTRTARPADGTQSADVFNLVIEAAKRNGMSLETWLQEAVQHDHSREAFSENENALKKLLLTQHNSRADAERAALLAQQELEQSVMKAPAEEDLDADAIALIHAIDDLSEQLNGLKSPTSEQTDDVQASKAKIAAVIEEAAQSEIPPATSDTQALDSLKARISALKDRIADGSHTLEETASPAKEPLADIDLEITKQTPTDIEMAVERTLTEQAAAPSSEPAPIQKPQSDLPDLSELDEKLERHFGGLGDKINSLLADTKANAQPENDHIRAQLEASLSKLEERLTGFPTKQDIAVLQPLAKLQVKLQADQERLGENFQRLADEQVRLQSGFGQVANTSEQIPQLRQQISELEASLKAIKPALTRDVASLLDVTVQKLEKVGKDKNPSAAPQAIQEQLDRLESVLSNLPSEIAQQQPNAQSLISFLPPRETLETIEHTVGRLEALLLEQQTTLGSFDTSEQTTFFKQRFDALLCRLDDTMKRFDAASLEADRRAQESISQQNSHQTSLMQQLAAQIESLEKKIEEAPALAATDQDAAQEVMRASHAELQDDLSRIEGQLGTVMETLEQHVSKVSKNEAKVAQMTANAEPTQDAKAVSTAVTDALIQPLNEALDRLERGLDARSRQTLDDLSALVKSTQANARPEDALQRSLNSVPDTLTILLDKIYDLESGVNRLQTQRDARTDALNAKISDTGAGEGPKQHRKPKHHEVLPPETQRNKAKGSTGSKPGMDYISAARRATSNRSTNRPDPKAEKPSETASIKKIKQRAEKILSRQREAVETDSDPSNRKKIVGICLGLTLIIAAVALALQSRDGGTTAEPLTTGSISGSTGSTRANRLVSNTFDKSGSAKTSRIIDQKIPDRLPAPPGARMWYSEKDTSDAEKSSKIAMPVARPKSSETAPAEKIFGSFVAPAPEKGIGPIGLRYKAATGDPVAQFEIGSRYADGFGVKPDMQKAVSWYQRAASQGLAPALYRLGSLLEHGRGAQQNKPKAAALYEKAAEKGNTKAMYNLGVLHAQGSLGKPDFATAAKWFTKAAEAGIKDGQFNLAILHARGMGVTTDLEEAYFWFAVAAKDNDPDAVAKRDALGQDLLTVVRQKLDAKVAQWRSTKLPANANNVSMPKEGWLAVQIPVDAEKRLAKHSQTAGSEAPSVDDNIQAIFEQVGTISGNLDSAAPESRI
ncbi:MAG: hypothetical protein ABJO09_06115 [Hyphomicrobiales bacterium]